MKIKMELLSDAIFGNGVNIPGGEDISVLVDVNGFPYYKGSTFKGVFRDTCIKYLEWSGIDKIEIQEVINLLLGYEGDDRIDYKRKLVFTDFVLSDYVRKTIMEEIHDASQVLPVLSNVRMFTSVEDGMAKEGSLRVARCVDRGMVFYGEIGCDAEDELLVEEVIGMIKWIGMMKSRGFGKVRISRVEEDEPCSI